MIVESISENGEFYFFRNNGTEIKCSINAKGYVKTERYRLTENERKIVKKYFRVNNTYVINERP